MGLTSVLQIGRSGIAVSQAGIQVAGNNMSNAATPGFSRQTMTMSPIRGSSFGRNIHSGNGVQVSSLVRHIDEAVVGRMRTALSDEEDAIMSQQLLTQLETLQNELSDADISTGLTEFFATWNELAARPDDNAVRALVIQRGAILTEQFRSLREDYVDVQVQIDRNLGVAVQKANELTEQIATLNAEITFSERGQGLNSALRDQRDTLLNELSELTDINTITQDSGSVDVFIGSIPIVLGNEARGVDLQVTAAESGTEVAIRSFADGSRLPIRTGRIGALLGARDADVTDAMDDLDSLAGALVWNVNRAHSNGQGTIGHSSLTGTYQVADEDEALNSTDADLPFDIKNGSFLLHLMDSSTGARTTQRIEIDLDGIGTDTSMTSLVASINSALGGSGATASISVDSKLKLDADSGFTISFSEDSSGVLAGLGVNTYFTGDDATNIQVNESVLDSHQLLSAGIDHIEGSNGTALAIATLGQESLDEFNGVSLDEFWSNNVEDLAVRVAAGNTKVDATRVVRQSLDAQRAAVSGVSLDEESVNLINFQQQYQASARLIAIAEELTQVLLSIV